jgi:hypothetical protein
MRSFLPRVFFLAVVVLFVAPLALWAQQAQPVPQRDPQAVTVLTQSLAAMGGAGASQVQDSLTQAAVTFPGSSTAGTATVAIKTKGPDRMRVDNSAGGRVAGVITDRGRLLRQTDKGWVVGPSSNARHKRVTHLPVLLLAYELARSDLSATYVGLEAVGTQPAHHIRLARVSASGNAGFDDQLTKNSQIDLFVNLQTFLVVKVSYIHLSDLDWRVGLPEEVYYSDYRSVGGIIVPFSQRTVFNGNPIFDLRLSSVAFNVGMTDADFVGR